MCFDFLCNFCSKHFLFYEEQSETQSKMYIALHVKYRLFLSGFYETGVSRQTSEKYSNIIFREDPFNGSRVIPSGQTDRRTDMRKLTFAFRNFAKQPKTGIVTGIQGTEIMVQRPGL